MSELTVKDLIEAFNLGYTQGKKDALRHGEWIIADNGDMICTVCTYRFSDPTYYLNDKCCYCANCGAKMDGAGNETN